MLPLRSYHRLMPIWPAPFKIADRASAEDWIRAHVVPVGATEIVHERPWATVMRVPLANGSAWFKACGPVQAFEPRLTAALFARWPDRVSEVLGHDEARSWLLLADAGTPIKQLGNPPETWLAVLPLYAELQRSEAAHADEHLAHGVPDLRFANLPARYQDLFRGDLPLGRDDITRLRNFALSFAELCAEVGALAVPATIQHDDLHLTNVYARGRRLRILDWGDASIGHPFTSLVETFRFLEEFNRLPPTDPWFARLRDSYLEPWGNGLDAAFALALRVGAFAHAIAWLRQRDALPEQARTKFDEGLGIVLRRAAARTVE
jgi:hypothetical protein